MVNQYNLTPEDLAKELASAIAQKHKFKPSDFDTVEKYRETLEGIILATLEED